MPRSGGWRFSPASIQSSIDPGRVPGRRHIRIKSNVEAFASLSTLMKVAPSNQEFRGCRNFRNSLQQLRQSLNQLLMRWEQKTQLFRGEQQINIRAKFAGSAKDFFFCADFITRPRIALGSFKNAGRRVHRRQKLAQLRHALGFLHLRQKLRVAFQIVIAIAMTVRISRPRKFQRLVVSPELHRKISFHIIWPELAAAPYSVQRSSPSALRESPPPQRSTRCSA